MQTKGGRVQEGGEIGGRQPNKKKGGVLKAAQTLSRPHF
jgi:hypothetical protein